MARLFPLPPAVRSRLSWGLVTLLGLGLFFPGLGVPGLMDPDEGRYAEIAREMLLLRDWLIPHLNLVPYLEKPPLVYWLTSMSLGAFGLAEWAARLPSALAALAGLYLAFLAGAGPVGGAPGALGGRGAGHLRGLPRPGPAAHPGHGLHPVPEPGDRAGVPGPEPGAAPPVALCLPGPGPGGYGEGTGGPGAGRPHLGAGGPVPGDAGAPGPDPPRELGSPGGGGPALVRLRGLAVSGVPPVFPVGTPRGALRERRGLSRRALVVLRAGAGGAAPPLDGGDPLGPGTERRRRPGGPAVPDDLGRGGGGLFFPVPREAGHLHPAGAYAPGPAGGQGPGGVHLRRGGLARGRGGYGSASWCGRCGGGCWWACMAGGRGCWRRSWRRGIS